MKLKVLLMNNLFVVSAPSGCGKTSLITALVAKINNLIVSTSHTTRKIRDGETNNKDYFFINTDKFNKLIQNNEFVEYAKVFDNYYGTSKNHLIKSLEKNDIILEIDWQGARQVANYFEKVISVFIIPPNLSTLRQRLILRGDKEEVINHRMLAAKDEIKHYEEYDFLLINNNFKQTLAELENIILTAQLTVKKQQLKYKKIINILLDE